MRLKLSKLTNRFAIALTASVFCPLLFSTVADSSCRTTPSTARELYTVTPLPLGYKEKLTLTPASEDDPYCYAVRQETNPENWGAQILLENPSGWHGPVFVESDYGKFPVTSLYPGSSKKSPTVITFSSIKKYTLFGHNLFDTQDLELEGAVYGKFGTYDEYMQKARQFPPVFMTGVHFSTRRVSQQSSLLSADRLYLSFQGLGVMSDIIDSAGDDSLAMDWLVKGKLISARRQIELVDFSFDAALSHHPHFYASNFQAQSISPAVTVKHSTASNKDIVITVEEIVSLNTLLAKILFILLVVGITITLRFKILKRFISRFSNSFF